jgi:cytochrome P450 family 4 subfamily V
MGVKLSAQTNHESEYVQAVQKMSEVILHYERKPWLWLKPIFYATGYGYEYDRCMKILKEFTEKVITERSEQYERDRLQNEFQNKDGESKPARQAFLDLLLSMQGEDKLTIEGITEEVDTFMFEGHDTTSSGMSWTIFLLGHHPRVQQKVFEEMESIFGDSNRDPKPEDLREMKYLECVIKESLRLFPPVPWFARKASEEFVAGTYTMPKNSNVNVMPYFIHRDKAVYGEDAEDFRPERFQTEEITGRNPYAYIPFSAGPRNCIGQKFALMEEKSVLSAVIRHFRIESLETREEVQEVFDLILRPKHKLLVRVTSRK